MTNNKNITHDPFNPLPHIYPGMPVGAVIAFAGEIRSKHNEQGSHKTNLPMFNWLLCDGSTVKIAQYPELFAALGYRYGGHENNGGQFTLPDYQGTFLRGVSSKDKGSLESRTSSNTSNAQIKHNSVGSTQKYALLNHKHTYNKPKRGQVVPAEPPEGGISSYPASDVTGKPTTKSAYLSELEVRPANTFVYWLIKAKAD